MKKFFLSSYLQQPLPMLKAIINQRQIISKPANGLPMPDSVCLFIGVYSVFPAAENG